ncbi:MAG: hypothetical protein ABIR70_18405 [Bryobacteraceae bacterium]
MLNRRIATLALFVSAIAHAQFNFGSSLFQLAVDPVNRDTLWARTSTSSTTGFQALYRSQDQGKTWRGIPFNTSLGTPITALRTHPTLGGRLFVLTNSAGGYLWTTTDGGETWKNPSAGWTANLAPQQVFVAAPPSQLVYVQVGTQLRRSTDGGLTFDGGVEIPCSGGIETSPSDPRRLACVKTSDRTMYVSTDEGRTWAPRATVPASSVISCTIINDLRNADVYYVYCFTTVSGLQRDQFFRSTDGLATLNAGAAPSNGFPVFYVSPDRSIIIVRGAGSGNSISRDLGLTWSSFGTAGTDDYGFDPIDSNIVYRNGSERSSNGAQTFTAITPRQYFPIFPTAPPLEVTLESGTAYVPTIEVKTLEGGTFAADRFTVTAPSAAWLQATPVPFVSAAGLTAGTYEASFALVSGGTPTAQFAIKLQVVPQRDPPIFLRATRIAGNGKFVSEPSATPGPLVGDDGPALSAPLSTGARILASDSNGNLYLNYQYRVQKIDTNGIMRQYAGTGGIGSSGDGDSSRFATFRNIADILYTDDGLLIVDSVAGNIRQVRTNGVITTFYTASNTGPSLFDAKLALDSNGTLHLGNSTGVYRWQGNNTWTRLFFNTDVAPAINGNFAFFRSFAIDKRNNSFLIAFTDRISRRTAAGQVTVVVGTPGKVGFAGDGNNTATGSLTESPSYLSVDAQGTLYFVDHNRIRVVTAAGVIGTVAGSGFPYSDTAPIPTDNSLATSTAFGPFWGPHVAANGDLLAFSAPALVYRLVAGAAPTSSIDGGGVVTLAGKAKVAPGAIFSIYGKLMADGVVNDPTPPLKNRLGSTQVQVNGADIPLFYVSPGQINAQMPYNVPVGTASVRVIRNGVATSEQIVQIVAAAPDVIQYGAGRAVAVNQNGSVNGVGTPAATGSYVVLYLTGIGVVSPALVAGQAAPVSPLAQTALPNKITLSNGTTSVDIAPLFLGHTPTYAGLVQANFQIPNIPAGDYNLTLTVGTEPSNVTKLAVGP